MFVPPIGQTFRPTRANVQVFTALGKTGGVTNSNGATWSKPPNTTFCYFLTVGAGGNGGATNGTSAGGGGGSGGTAAVIAPAMFVPDILDVVVGQPGSGAGAAGNSSGIAWRNGNTSLILVQSGGGNGGTAGAGGAGGSNGGTTTWLLTTQNNLLSGVAGSTTTTSASTTSFLSGGSVGSNTGQMGYKTASGGGHGFTSFTPLVSVGAGWAAGAPFTTGIGCGGNGEGTTGSSSWGVGGPGIVVIISW